MNASIRFASPYIPFGMETVNHGHDDGHCKMGGTLGVIFEIMIHESRRLVPNFKCTIDTIDSVGSYNQSSKLYSGAIGDVFNDKFDSFFLPVIYPIIDEDDAIEYSPPFIEDQMKILSFYSVSLPDNSDEKDILFMFNTVPTGLWIGLSISFLVFASIFYTGFHLLDGRQDNSDCLQDDWEQSRKKSLAPSIKSIKSIRSIKAVDKSEKSSEAIWTTFCAFLNQHNYPMNGTFILILSTFMSVSLFYAVSYLTNSVSTDLVVVPDPVTITTYDEIIERKLNVLTNKMMSEREKFLEMDPKKKEHQLSKQFVEQEADVDKLTGTVESLFKQESVVVARPMVVESVALYSLSRATDGRARALIVPDREASRFTNIFIFRKDVKIVIINTIQKM